MKTSSTIDWSDRQIWKVSAKNTFWCLLGCAIGDLGTILFFQLTQIPFPLIGIMILAIINGLITSIILETVILVRQNFPFNEALKTASKKGTGKSGFPEFTAISKDFILVIENKEAYYVS